MRTLRRIMIHCAYTFPEMDIGVDEIRRWHVDGNGWRDIGYHFVIRRDGTRERGRPIDLPGAHVAGHNADSVGICLVGGKRHAKGSPFNFTRDQLRELEILVIGLFAKYPTIKDVSGHNDWTNAKTCPQFDVKAWWNA